MPAETVSTVQLPVKRKTGAEQALDELGNEPEDKPATGQKPVYRLSIARDKDGNPFQYGPDGKRLNRVQDEPTSWVSLGSLWRNTNGKLSGRSKPSIKYPDGRRQDLNAVTLTAGEYINCLEVRQ